jgi:hypothetical protein
MKWDEVFKLRDDNARLRRELAEEQARHAETLQYNADIGTALTEYRHELAKARELLERSSKAVTKLNRATHILDVENFGTRPGAKQLISVMKEIRTFLAAQEQKP